MRKNLVIENFEFAAALKNTSGWDNKKTN
jgi:hypothetical protein